MLFQSVVVLEVLQISDINVSISVRHPVLRYWLVILLVGYSTGWLYYWLVILLVGYSTGWLYYWLVILLVGYTTSCIRDNMYVSQPFTCAISFRVRNNLQRKVKGQLLRNVNYLYQTVCSYSLLYYLITNNSNTRESILH